MLNKNVVNFTVFLSIISINIAEIAQEFQILDAFDSDVCLGIKTMNNAKFNQSQKSICTKTPLSCSYPTVLERTIIISPHCKSMERLQK